ncbi:MAG: 2'-5' RNA ligase family protein [Bacteroidota bacterium]|jgi:tRNA nucleotidyltransferase/poly(A) polymerase/2'-5' RNA ligase
MRISSAENGTKTGDGTGVGVFIPLPEHLAKQFPSLGGEDKSPPHCTFLYVGKVEKDREERFLKAVREALSNVKGVVRGSLYGPEYFVHPAKERRVAVMRVRFNQDLAALRWHLRDALNEAGFNVDDSFPLVYQPHCTLQYLENLTDSYEGPIPQGDWTFEGIEVWGLSKLVTVPFGVVGYNRVAAVGYFEVDVQKAVCPTSYQKHADSSAHAKSIALMKFLSAVVRKLGVAEHVFVVGGAVRNFIIHEPIKDVDVVVDSVSLGGKNSEWFANEVIKAIPVPANLTTNNYGVAIITVKGDWELDGQNLAGEIIEIANARKESYGEGGYKPDKVEPATIHDDIVRREFSFNTLMWRLYDLANGPDKAEILDLSGCGLKDLQEGTMRCPSSPDKTFTDDPSRMIRAIKFLLRYGFKIAPEVEASIRRNAQKLKNIPPGHLSNMIINLFYETGVGKRAFLEMDKLGLLDVIREIVDTVRPFRDALGNWAEKHADIQFVFDLMDLHLPVGHALSFLTPAQKSQLRENLVGFPAGAGDGAEDYMGFLAQPGKLIDMPRLIQALGLKGPGIKNLTDTIRQMILDDVALINTPDHLESLILLRMGGIGARTASAKSVHKLLAAFISEARDAGYEPENLGDVEGFPVLLIHPKEIPEGHKRILVVGGIHGDEPSGTNSCLEVLKDIPKNVSLSFLPMLNPVGRKKFVREESEGKDLNRGWYRDSQTPEGEFIHKNKSRLKRLAQDGVLSLHEDDQWGGFYLYDGEYEKTPGLLARRLLEVGRGFFPVAKDNEDDFGNKLRGGFILDPHDDSFEDWMHFDAGVTPVILAELPTKSPWSDRVKCGEALIRAFVEFVVQEKNASRVAARYLSGVAKEI